MKRVVSLHQLRPQARGCLCVVGCNAGGQQPELDPDPRVPDPRMVGIRYCRWVKRLECYVCEGNYLQDFDVLEPSERIRWSDHWKWHRSGKVDQSRPRGYVCFVCFEAWKMLSDIVHKQISWRKLSQESTPERLVYLQCYEAMVGRPLCEVAEEHEERRLCRKRLARGVMLESGASVAQGSRVGRQREEIGFAEEEAC